MSDPASSRAEYITPLPELPEGLLIVGVSVAIRRAAALALRFAPTDLPILLVGPTGAGKELFARQIHHWSGRPGPFMDVNAGALPREMVESLLFGHRRGAFTGAVESSEGLLTAAGAGTFLLDELTSLPLEGQAKLLRVLESGEVRPLGTTATRPVRCRFIAAAQGGLNERIAAGVFRLDLYQRLAGVVITLSGLAERMEDVIPLARAIAGEHGRALTPDGEEVLLTHRWPGNVRELRAVIHRAIHLGEQELLSPEVLREAIGLSLPLGGTRTPAPTKATTPLLELCKSHGWDIGRAAASLGVGRSTLYRRLRAAGIDPGIGRFDATLETGWSG